MDIKTQRMCPNAGLLTKKKWLFDKVTFKKCFTKIELIMIVIILLIIIISD